LFDCHFGECAVMVCSLISCIPFSLYNGDEFYLASPQVFWFQSFYITHYYYLPAFPDSKNSSTLRMLCYEGRYFSPQAFKFSSSPCCTNQSATWMCRSNYLNLETLHHLMIASIRSSGFVWDCQSCYIRAMPLEPPYLW
jgi:hypothetical protein